MPHRTRVFPLAGRHLWLIAAIAALWLALFGYRINFGYNIIYDAYTEFFPVAAFNVKGIERWSLWTWNPYIYGGYSSASDPQGMLFAPLFNLVLLLGNESSLQTFQLACLLHLLVGGVGLAFLLRDERRGLWAILAAACVYMAGGYALSRLQHTPIVLAYGFVPWVLLGYLRVITRSRLRDAAVLGVATGLMLLQLVQLSYLVVVAMGFHLLVMLATGAVRLRWTLVKSLLVSVGIFLLVAGPELFSFLLVFPYYSRQEFTLDIVAERDLQPLTLLTLLFPNIFNNVAGVFALEDDSWGIYADITESYFYVGGFFLVLAVLGLAASFSRYAERRRPSITLAVCMLVLSLVYSLGTVTPIYVFLHSFLPGVSLFRRPLDGMYLFNLALALFVAAGATRMAIWIKVRPAAAATAFALAAGLALANMLQNLAIPELRIWFALAAIVLAGAAIHTFWQPRATVLAAACVAAIVEVAGLSSTTQFNSGFDLTVRQTRADNEALMAALAPVVVPGEVPERFDSPSTFEHFHQNWSWLFGLASIHGYSPFRYGLVDSLALPIEIPGAEQRVVEGVDSDWYRRLLRVNRTATREDPAPDDWRCENVEGIDYRVCTRTEPLPFALNPTVIEPAGTTALVAGGYDPRTTAVVEIETPDSLQACTGKVSVGAVRFDPTRLRLDIQASEGGLLVLTEPWHPYWYATADGAPTPILKANGINRAVCVPPGTKEVELVYDLFSWRSVRGFIEERLRAP